MGRDRLKKSGSVEDMAQSVGRHDEATEKSVEKKCVKIEPRACIWAMT